MKHKYTREEVAGIKVDSTPYIPPEVFDEFKKIFEERHPEDEIGNMTAEDVCNMYQDELEEYIKTVPEKLI